jgi:hypothetical protein
MSKPYLEKLKDPRWQRKRLEIFQRDNWTCKFCGDTESMLMVHHFKYEGNPWEVDNEHLGTCCARCHKEEHEELALAKHLFITEMEASSVAYNSLTAIIKQSRKAGFCPTTILFILQKCFEYDENFPDKLPALLLEGISRKVGVRN